MSEGSKLIPEKDYEFCEKQWKTTLEFFGITRPVLSFEKMKIARLIKQYDSVSVAYALAGARFETKTKDFDPGKHVGLYRLDNPQIFEKFLNLASQAMEKQRKTMEIKNEL